MTIEQQAHAIVRDLDDIKETVCRGGAVPRELTESLLRVKRSAARLAAEARERPDVLSGYQRDVHGELVALRALIDQQGCDFAVLNRPALRVVMLAAENFAERARNYLTLVEEQEAEQRRSVQRVCVSLNELREVTDAA